MSILIKQFSFLSTLFHLGGGFIPKAYEVSAIGNSVVVASYDASHNDSRLLFFESGGRSGLAVIKSDKSIEWIYEPNGFSNYYEIVVGDTNISIKQKAGSLSAFKVAVF